MFKKIESTDAKKFGWGCVAGAIIVLIVVFSTGWMVTSKTAKKQAEKKAEMAVEKRLADICVYKFKNAKNTDKKLKKIEDMKYSWDRAEYIKKQGWSTMPGKESPSPGVADNCAKQLMQMNNE
mgnify:CR=1 FL=1